MSAECEKHGVDLHGNEWSEGGLVCPVCKRDECISVLEARLEAVGLLKHWAGFVLECIDGMRSPKSQVFLPPEIACENLRKALGFATAETKSERDELIEAGNVLYRQLLSEGWYASGEPMKRWADAASSRLAPKEDPNG